VISLASSGAFSNSIKLIDNENQTGCTSLLCNSFVLKIFQDFSNRLAGILWKKLFKLTKVFVSKGTPISLIGL